MHPVKDDTITLEELYAAAIGGMPTDGLHPIHRVLMEECCEQALAVPTNGGDIETLVHSVHVAMFASIELLKATLLGTLAAVKTDRLTINFRGQEFVLQLDSPFFQG